MHTRDTITIVIVTKNRAHLLAECLDSLLQQTVTPTAIVVVNNNSTDSTSKLLSHYKKKLPLREVIEKRIGYPFVYNRGLIETKTKWAAFIDDDCVADTGWFETICATIKKSSKPKLAAILGSSKNFYPKNIWACLSQIENEMWRAEYGANKQITNYQILDSRNCIYNAHLLKKNNLKFDAAFIQGGEDSDLGLSIQESGLLAHYQPKSIIYHKEPNTLRDYWRKKLQYAPADPLLKKKHPHSFTQNRNPLRFQQKTQLIASVTAQLPLPARLFVFPFLAVKQALIRFIFKFS